MILLSISYQISSSLSSHPTRALCLSSLVLFVPAPFILLIFFAVGTFFFHLAFPHIVLLFVINLPHVICACFSCCFSSVKKAPFFYIIKLLYYYCLTGVIRVLPGKMESFSHLFEWRLNREAKMAHSTWPTWKKFWGTSDGDKSIWREDLTCYKVRKSVSVWSTNPFTIMSGLSPPALLRVYTRCLKWHNSYLIINYWRETEEQCEIRGGNKHER